MGIFSLADVLQIASIIPRVVFLGTSSAISSPDDTAGAEHCANTFHGPHSTGFKQCTVSELAFKHYGEAGGGAEHFSSGPLG